MESTTSLIPIEFVWDIETNGFKYDRVLCLTAICVQTADVFEFADQPGYRPIREGVALLEGADLLIGHNILGFDAPALRKLYGAVLAKEKLFDTLTATRMLWPDQRDTDTAEGILPAQLIGRHSLEAWGRRLGQFKGHISDFTRWSPAMQAYCLQDVIATWALFNHILENGDVDISD